MSFLFVASAAKPSREFLAILGKTQEAYDPVCVRAWLGMDLGAISRLTTGDIALLGVKCSAYL